MDETAMIAGVSPTPTGFKVAAVFQGDGRVYAIDDAGDVWRLSVEGERPIIELLSRNEYRWPAEFAKYLPSIDHCRYCGEWAGPNTDDEIIHKPTCCRPEAE